MSARTFEPTDSEQEDTQDSENDGDHNEQKSQEEDESDPDAPEPQVKKKRAVRLPREFKEVDRWDRCDSTNEDIIVFIRRHLDRDECNQNARSRSGQERIVLVTKFLFVVHVSLSWKSP